MHALVSLETKFASVLGSSCFGSAPAQATSKAKKKSRIHQISSARAWFQRARERQHQLVEQLGDPSQPIEIDLVQRVERIVHVLGTKLRGVGQHQTEQPGAPEARLRPIGS